MKFCKLTVLFAALSVATLSGAAGCDSGGGGEPEGEGSGDSSLYIPFQDANLQSQLLRVGAYEEIKSLRKTEGFGPRHFGGGCEGWNPEAGAPSASDRIASLYIETASLATKVEGRTDDHAYNTGAALGADIHASICGAIAEGSAVTDGTGSEAVGGTGWQAQVVDKALQHFFYLSVFHEMMQGARKNWDEAVGYYGMALDRSKTSGLAATAADRDGSCGTTYATDIFDLLVAGQTTLDEALTAAGKDGNEDALETIPAELQGIIDAVDAKLLEVSALSLAHELMELEDGSNGAIERVEARMFFRILEPRIAAFDAESGTTHAADIAAQLEQDDPAQVTPAALIDAVDAVFDLDSRAICGE